MEPFIGEVRLLPYTFAPQGWALCNGQLLPISSNAALYAIIGTLYGGNGKSTFALPNLQGRVVPGAGQGPALQQWNEGMAAGMDAVTLLTAEIPQHIHSINGLDVTGSESTPSEGDFLAQDKRGGQGGNIDYLVPGSTTPDKNLAPQALSLSGESQPHENRQPFLSVNFCIALQGLYPSRG